MNGILLIIFVLVQEEIHADFNGLQTFRITKQFHAIPYESMRKERKVGLFSPFSHFKAKNDLHGFCMDFAYAFLTCEKQAKFLILKITTI